jgi:hypothetical protein
VGLGVFIAPNNHATINASPASLSDEAGAMLNLMRVLGTSLGVAGASAMLSWRMQVASGSHERRLALVSERQRIEAAASGLLLLAVFAAAAGALSMLQDAGRLRRFCGSEGSAGRSPTKRIQGNPKTSKEIGSESKKKILGFVWILLDSFVRFGSFQWVSGQTPKNALSSLSSIGAVWRSSSSVSRRDDKTTMISAFRQAFVD